jgi:hypothetical protein
LLGNWQCIVPASEQSDAGISPWPDRLRDFDMPETKTPKAVSPLLIHVTQGAPAGDTSSFPVTAYNDVVVFGPRGTAVRASVDPWATIAESSQDTYRFNLDDQGFGTFSVKCEPTRIHDRKTAGVTVESVLQPSLQHASANLIFGEFHPGGSRCPNIDHYAYATNAPANPLLDVPCTIYLVVRGASDGFEPHGVSIVLNDQNAVVVGAVDNVVQLSEPLSIGGDNSKYAIIRVVSLPRGGTRELMARITLVGSPDGDFLNIPLRFEEFPLAQLSPTDHGLS